MDYARYEKGYFNFAQIANLIDEMYNDNVSDNLIPFTVNG